METNETVFIHESAIVDRGAEIGDHSKIWHWTHVCSGAKIGEHCSLGQNVFVSSEARIGDNVKIQNNVSIYDKVILENNVFCGPSSVFTNVNNPRSEVSRKKEYLDTHIMEGVTLGANCTIVCGHTIGAYAFIGAGAVVTKNIPAFALVVGVPAKQIGWISAFGERMNLPLSGNGKWRCDSTGDLYKLNGNTMTRLKANVQE